MTASRQTERHPTRSEARDSERSAGENCTAPTTASVIDKSGRGQFHGGDGSVFKHCMLSVIIPALNEETAIGGTIDRVLRGAVKEVIVVDGGSTDRTRDIAAAKGATVVGSTRGRGRQLAAGAALATGDTLLFLHADTLLPDGFADWIGRTLDKPEVCAGAFSLSIDAEGRSLRWLERAVNFRSRVRQMPYGDQAVFVSADVYRDVGGFLDVPIMEDYALVRRLRRVGTIETVPSAVVTSGRRWVEHGVLHTTVCNQMIIAAFRLGVSPNRIARWRKKIACG